MEIMRTMPAMISPPGAFPIGEAPGKSWRAARGRMSERRRGADAHIPDVGAVSIAGDGVALICDSITGQNGQSNVGFGVKYGLFCACLRYQALSTYFILVIPVPYITMILPELRSGINRAARHTQARGDGAAAPHRAPCNMRGGCRAGRNTGGLATGGRHGNRGSACRATGGFPQLATGATNSANWRIPPVGCRLSQDLRVAV